MRQLMAEVRKSGVCVCSQSVSNTISPPDTDPTRQGKRLQGRARNLRGEKEELDEDISEAQAAASGASATQAGLFEDLQAEVEAADEEIAAAQEAQKAIKAEQQQVRMADCWGAGSLAGLTLSDLTVSLDTWP